MPKRPNHGAEVDPYRYVPQCLGEKWRMTPLHGIHTFGKIRFNQILKVPPISEKVPSQQLKELIDDGLIRSTSYDVIPSKVEYRLMEAGNELISALGISYIWAIHQMADKGIPIDADNFVVHLSERYMDSFREYIKEESLFWAAQKERNTKNERDGWPKEKNNGLPGLYSNPNC